MTRFLILSTEEIAKDNKNNPRDFSMTNTDIFQTLHYIILH